MYHLEALQKGDPDWINFLMPNRRRLFYASSEESVGEGERQGWLSTRNLRSFLQVESARQNATFIFGRERRETGENVGHVKILL